jgi:hypothetical protein
MDKVAHWHRRRHHKPDARPRRQRAPLAELVGICDTNASRAAELWVVSI